MRVTAPGASSGRILANVFVVLAFGTSRRSSSLETYHNLQLFSFGNIRIYSLATLGIALPSARFLFVGLSSALADLAIVLVLGVDHNVAQSSRAWGRRPTGRLESFRAG